MHSGMGGMDQNFHKDGHHIPMRHHRPRWIMGMYFCTDTVSALCFGTGCVRAGGGGGGVLVVCFSLLYFPAYFMPRLL
jgi:hypothetical protein